jgi:hypothetical protein
MTQTSGENNSKNSDRVLLFQGASEKYTASLGLKHIFYNPEVEFILSLTKGQLNAMSEEECGVGGFLLKSYATFIQREYNKHKAVTNWANRELDFFFSQEYHNIGDKFTKADVKRMMFIAQNSGAKALYDIIVKSEGICTELEFVSMRLADMGDALSRVKQVKLSKRYNE